MRYLLSLVSEQPIPNILLIKTLRDIDGYIFVSTPRMKSQALVERTCDLCGISSPVVVEVDEYDLEGISAKVAGCLQNLGPDSVAVNLTGGTKLMALGVYMAIQQFPAQAFYLPPGSACAHIVHPSFIKDFLPLSHQLDASSFLFAYGVTAEIPSSPSHHYELGEAMFRLQAEERIPELANKLSRLGNRRLDLSPKNIQLKEILASTLGLKPELLSCAEWLKFVKGGWFEEYICHHLQRMLPQTDVCRNVVTDKNGVKNELDICFAHANTLYVWELKSSVKIAELKDILYRLDSLKNDYGLRPRCLLALASPATTRLWQGNSFLQDRAAGMGIRVLTCPELAPERIQQSIREVLN